MWGRSLCPPPRHPLALEGKGRSSTQPAFISPISFSCSSSSCSSSCSFPIFWLGRLCLWLVCVFTSGPVFHGGVPWFSVSVLTPVFEFLSVPGCMRPICFAHLWTGFSLCCCLVRAWCILTLGASFTFSSGGLPHAVNAIPHDVSAVIYTHFSLLWGLGGRVLG